MRATEIAIALLYKSREITVDWETEAETNFLVLSCCNFQIQPLSLVREGKNEERMPKLSLCLAMTKLIGVGYFFLS